MSRLAAARRLDVSLAPFTLPGGQRIDPVEPAVARRLSPQEARRLGLLPFTEGHRALYVASLDPPRPGALQRAQTLGADVRIVFADAQDLQAAHRRAYTAQGQRLGRLLMERGVLSREKLALGLLRQRRQGGRLGEALVAAGLAQEMEVAVALGAQYRLPAVDMDGLQIQESLFSLLSEEQWRACEAVPLSRHGARVQVAVADPAAEPLRTLFAARHPNLRLMPCVASAGALRATLEARYGRDDLARSRLDLRRKHPDRSADRLLSRGQAITLTAIGILLSLLLLRYPRTVAAVLVSLSQVAYLLLLLWKVRITRPQSGAAEPLVSQGDLAALDPRTLPVYSVLVPMRAEAAVLPELLRSLALLDYPKDRLDVHLLLEADDPETLSALEACAVPAYVTPHILAAAEPRTKPKACNYGLRWTRGEFIVIFDAEDRPEPDQLKKAVLAFRHAPEHVACLQAKLSYWNARQNLLTRWFTAEYALWFDLLLPALQRRNLPIPLGGTSNHLRRCALEEVGAWDPYNVTEDADLGVRLARRGYRTEMLDATTYEEANSDFINWVRQRSRWVKGYLQTYLVHMRSPLRLWRDLGTRGFLGFQLVIGGTPFSFLAAPFFWILTSLWFAAQPSSIQGLFPVGIYYGAMVSLLAGNFLLAYLQMTGAARRDAWDLVLHASLSPIYWGLMSLAAWKAAWQILTRPFHWEKTIHGLAPIPEHRTV